MERKINHEKFAILLGMNIDSAWAAMQSWFFDHGWKIVLIIIIAILVRHFGMLFFSRVIARSVENSSRLENARDRKLRIATLNSLFESIINILTALIIGVLILSELGVFRYLAPLFSSAVAISLVIGFGIQTFVKDYVSGIFIVAENQYRVGDVVHIYGVSGGDFEGTVIDISLRTTEIRDIDGTIHFIPNGNIARAANQTLDYAKVNVEIELPIGADLDRAEKEIGALGLTMSKEEDWQRSLIQAPYFHGVQCFEKESIKIEVRAKTSPAEQWRVSSELQKRLAKLVSSEKFFEKKKKTSGS